MVAPEIPITPRLPGEVVAAAVEAAAWLSSSATPGTPLPVQPQVESGALREMEAMGPVTLGLMALQARLASQ